MKLHSQLTKINQSGGNTKQRQEKYYTSVWTNLWPAADFIHNI